MIVSLASLAKFTNNTKTDPELLTMYLTAAQNIVARELGYDPEAANLPTPFTETYFGNNLNTVILSAFNITVSSFQVNGVNVAYHVIDNILFIDAPTTMYTNTDKITVTYTAGWTTATLPAEIKNCIMQIATLKSMEERGNVGFTTSVVGEIGAQTRTFTNTVNFSKFFPAIRSYKVLNFWR